MRQKIFILTLLLIPIIYLYFVLKYIPSNSSNFQNIEKYFGSSEFTGKLNNKLTSNKGTKSVFNFNKITFYNYSIPILMYHYVEYNPNKADFKRDQLNIEPHIFEQQIQTLLNNNYEFITANNLASIIKENKKVENKYVVLTFDDGYRDFYTDVLPILKKYNVKATLYIVYNFLDNPNYLYKWQVDEIIKSNLVEIGSHTLNHTYLKGTNANMVQNEVQESKNKLENTFNIKINSFAYPYGAYDDFAKQQVQKAGYTNAVTTDLGITANNKNIFSLKRIRPGYNTGNNLTGYLNKLQNY